MKTYSELLRDPRWQRKRLEIMERDNFCCRICERSDLPLNVHHIYYEKGLKPWEYPAATLLTLCEPHHEKETDEKEAWERRFIECFRKMGATNGTLERLILIFGDLEKEYGFGRLALLEHLLSEQENVAPRAPTPTRICERA